MNTDTLLRRIVGIFSSTKKATCAPPLAVPVRDWQLLLLCAVVLFCVSALWASSIYVLVKRGPEATENDTFVSARATQLNESGLARMLTLRDARVRLHEEYLRGL